MSLLADPNVIAWPLEAIWQATEPDLPGFTCEVLPEVDSTNTELMRRFKAGRLEPTLLVAEKQTAGRGRLGRQWHGGRHGSLMFSLGLKLAPADWSGLSLAVGVSLAESLDAHCHADHRIGLKWPNDLWLQTRTKHGFDERKLGGVLVETASFDNARFVVVGVGINVKPVALAAQHELSGQPQASPVPTQIAPGCLQELAPEADAATTLLCVLPALVQTLLAFEQFGFVPFQARFARRDVLAGRHVLLSGGKPGVSGQAHGVTESGALLVHTANGMSEITSSEVSVRPVPGQTLVTPVASVAGLPPC